MPEVASRLAAASVLAVCAHPDDESFGLGAVLDHLAAGGARTAVLCFSHGEASTLTTSTDDLGRIRGAELAAAAEELGVEQVELLDHPDGGLGEVPLELLAGAVERAVSDTGADLLLVFDESGVTGHPDHRRATQAVLAARADVPVVAWGVPADVARTLNGEFCTSFSGHERSAYDVVLAVDRTAQRRAIACHASQATDNPVLWRRLQLLGDDEHLRWLRAPHPTGRRSARPAHLASAPTERSQEMPATVHVAHLGGDRFEIGVRQHRLLVDQPVPDGGDDQAPTPTELFVSSLASCVAFYARRYLTRHDLPTEGLVVDADYDMTSRPARVGTITLRIGLPDGVPEDKRAALLAVAGHCTVHNSLVEAPEVTIDFTASHAAV